MKKLVVLAVIGLMLVAPAFAGGQTEGKTGATKIAIVCSGAGANDNGYNQSAIVGAEKVAKEFGVEYKVVEPTNGVPVALEALADDGYNLIFSLEYDFEALVKGVGGAKPLASQYPNTTFVVFNDSPNTNASGEFIHKNVISVLFDVHEGSFLAGVLSVEVIEHADKLFTEGYNFTPVNKGGRALGFIGGTNSNGITVFSYGYVQGVEYAAKNYGNYTYYTKYDAGFGDPALGSTVAGTYYSNGANVVYGVAGVVGEGITSKAKEVGKLAIQVDADKDSQQPGHVLTSVLKNTEVPVYKISKAFIDKTIGSMDLLQSYSLKSGAAGITDLKVISSKVKDKQVWNEIVAKVNDASNKIASGEIKVVNAQEGEIFDPKSTPHVTIK